MPTAVAASRGLALHAIIPASIQRSESATTVELLLPHVVDFVDAMVEMDTTSTCEVTPTNADIDESEHQKTWRIHPHSVAAELVLRTVDRRVFHDAAFFTRLAEYDGATPLQSPAVTAAAGLLVAMMRLRINAVQWFAQIVSLFGLLPADVLAARDRILVTFQFIFCGERISRLLTVAMNTEGQFYVFDATEDPLPEVVLPRVDQLPKDTFQLLTMPWTGPFWESTLRAPPHPQDSHEPTLESELDDMHDGEDGR